jgi:hypothetical protein
MQIEVKSESGMSLIEAMIAMLVLTVGATGMAAVFAYALRAASTGPNELIAMHKASEAIEGVFSARDSHSLTWDQLRNVSDGGIFLDDATDLYLAGDDGVVNSEDDSLTVESVELPGPDDYYGTGDDVTQDLIGFTRQVSIVDVTADLRLITVTITFPFGTATRTQELTALISRYA